MGLFLRLGALLLAALCAGGAGRAQTPPVRELTTRGLMSGELDLDVRARIAAIGQSGAKLHATRCG